MKARRVFHASRKTAEERAREQALRAKLQKEKPSLEDLIREGECDPDAVMTMGMYFDIQGALQALKRALNEARKPTPKLARPPISSPALYEQAQEPPAQPLVSRPLVALVLERSSLAPVSEPVTALAPPRSPAPASPQSHQFSLPPLAQAPLPSSPTPNRQP